MPLSSARVPEEFPPISNAIADVIGDIGAEMVSNLLTAKFGNVAVEGVGPTINYNTWNTAEKIGWIRRMPTGVSAKLTSADYSLKAVCAVVNPDGRYWGIAVAEFVRSVSAQVDPSEEMTCRALIIMTNVSGKPMVYTSVAAVLKSVLASFAVRADPVPTLVIGVERYLPSEGALGDPSDQIAKEIVKLQAQAVKLASIKAGADADVAAAVSLGWATGTTAQREKYVELQAAANLLAKQLTATNARIEELQAAGGGS